MERRPTTDPRRFISTRRCSSSDTLSPEGTGVGSAEGAGVSGSTSGSGASAEAGFWWMKSRAWLTSGRAATHSSNVRRRPRVWQNCRRTGVA
jgi:hypothetical protein